jgi:large subunit ribosomal protein L18
MRKVVKKIPSAKIARTYRRKLSIRKKVAGTSERPRVTISRGNKNLYVQVIDDVTGSTLLSSGTFGKNKVGSNSNVESAKLVGKDLGAKLKTKNISTVVFDRNGLKYCGIVEAVAQSIRESGVQF